MKTSSASASWQGNLTKGKGVLRLSTIGFETPYDFASRFEEGESTNPEELIGAAHAGCFSMALSNILSEEGFVPEEINTTAQVTISKRDKGFEITEIQLTTDAKVSGIEESKFLKLAETAKINCPVSKALARVNINLKARLLL